MVSLANSRQLSSTLIDFVHKLIGSIRRKKTWIQKLSFSFGTDKWKPNYNSRSRTNSCLWNRSHQVLTSFNQQQDESNSCLWQLSSVSSSIYEQQGELKTFSYKQLSISTLTLQLSLSPRKVKYINYHPNSCQIPSSIYDKQGE